MSAFYQMLQDLPTEGQEPVEEPQEQQENPSPELEQIADSLFEALPEEWRPTKKFASSDEELEFYRSKYPALWQHITSDQFADQFLDQYGDIITRQDQELQAARMIMKGLDKDPVNFLMTYIPEYAEQLGIGSYYDEDAISEIVESEIAKQFGENWKDVYDPADLVRRNSVSSQILKRTQAIEAELEQRNHRFVQSRNARLAEIAQRQQQQNIPSQQYNIEHIMDTAVDMYFEELQNEGVTEEEFIETFIQSMTFQPRMKDIHRIVNYDKIIDSERKKAYEEGRKSMLSEYRKAGKQAANDYVPRDTYNEEPKQKSFMGLRLGNMNGY
jgi:hypothetical protein